MRALDTSALVTYWTLLKELATSDALSCMNVHYITSLPFNLVDFFTGIEKVVGKSERLF
jgi:hypothetical protein